MMRTVLVLLLVSNDTHYQLFFYQLNIFVYTAYIGQVKPMLFTKDYAIEMIQLSFLTGHNLMMAGYTLPDAQ